MAGTSEGSRKAAARLIDEHGLDEDGKSNFHQRNGAKGGKNSTARYFRKLRDEDPAEFVKISRRGANASNKMQGKGKR